MRAKHIESNTCEKLNPELVSKIFENKTLETLIIRGEMEPGFFIDHQDMFATVLINAFKKNHSTDIVIFDDLSLDAIKLLLPALGKNTKLKICNLCAERINYIHTERSKLNLSIPELLDDNLSDNNSSKPWVSNKKKLDSLSDEDEPRKKSRLDNEMVIEEPKTVDKNSEDNEMVIEVQNPMVLNAPPAPQIKHLAIEKVEDFNNIRKTYLKCAPNYYFDKIVCNGSRKEARLKREFIALATAKNADSFKKFIPLLDKRRSEFEALKPYVLLLAVEDGNLEAVIRLLGGRVRMLINEATAENKEAVLAESELLIIRKPLNKISRTSIYYFGYKNENGVYEEQQIQYSKLSKAVFKEGQILCEDSIIINYAIKKARELKANQNFIYNRNISTKAIEDAILVALEKGNLPILFELLDTLILSEGYKVEGYKLSHTAANRFDNLINYVLILAIQQRYQPLITELLAMAIKNASLEVVVKYALSIRHYELLDEIFNSAFLSDQELVTYFKYSPDEDHRLERQSYFLNKAKNYFYSIAAKAQSYSVQVITNQDFDPSLQEKVVQAKGAFVLVFTSNNRYKLGFCTQDGYKEQLIDDEKNKILIERLLKLYGNTSNFNTMDWATRHLRLLLLSLGGSTGWQFDPESLAKIVARIEVDPLSSFQTLTSSDKKLAHLLFQTKIFDLSVDDNQFLRCLAKICWDSVMGIDQNQNRLESNRLGELIANLIANYPINPDSNLDCYVQGIEFAIAKGNAPLLKILIKHKPFQIPILTEIIRQNPKEMIAALEAGGKIKVDIYDIVQSAIQYYAPLPEKQQNYNLHQDQLAYNVEQLQKLSAENPQDHDQVLQLQKKIDDLEKAIKDFEQEKLEIQRLNLEVIRIVVPYLLIFKREKPEDLVTYFKKYPSEIFPANLYEILRSGILQSWPNMKPWRELRTDQNSFFKKAAIEIPNEIFDTIEQVYASVMSH